MSQNYDPQDSNKEDYSLKDYYQQGGQTPPPYEMRKANPDPYGNLEPPANGIFAKWIKVITRPSAATFASEIPDASRRAIFLGMLLYGAAYLPILVMGFVILGGGTIGPLGSTFSLIITVVIYSYIIAVIGLMLGSGLIYLLSKSVGKGVGDYATQTYLYSLYAFPLATIAALVGLVPGFSGIATFAAGIYILFLTYYMVQAVHRLSPDDARRVVFLTFLVGIIVVVIFVFLIISVLFSSHRIGL